MLTPDQIGIDFIDRIQKKDNCYKLVTTIPNLFIEIEYFFEIMQEVKIVEGVEAKYKYRSTNKSHI